jgi:hypothetical protein
VSIAGGYDKHHGCRLPLPRKQAPPAPAVAPLPPGPVAAAPAPPAPVAPPAPTPRTVYNVCHANPGLGHAFYGSVADGFPDPTIYWLYKATGDIAFAAVSTDGDPEGRVNVAGYWNLGNTGTPDYLALCTWAEWISVPTWNADHPASAPITSTTTAMDNPIFEDFTPDGPGCAGPEAIDGSGLCTVQPDDPDLDDDG